MTDGQVVCSWTCYEQGLEGLTPSAPVKYVQNSTGTELRIRLAISTLSSTGKQSKAYHQEYLTVEGEGLWLEEESVQFPSVYRPYRTGPRPAKIPTPPAPDLFVNGPYLQTQIPMSGAIATVPPNSTQIAHTELLDGKAKEKAKEKPKSKKKRKDLTRDGLTKEEVLFGAAVLFVAGREEVQGSADYVGQERKDGVVWRIIVCLGATCAVADHRPLYKGFYSRMTGTSVIKIVENVDGKSWREREVENPYFGLPSFTSTDKEIRRATRTAIEYVVHKRGAKFNPIQDSAAVYINKFWHNLRHLMTVLDEESRPARIMTWGTGDEGVPFSVLVEADATLKKFFQEMMLHAGGTDAKTSDGNEVPYSDDISANMVVSLRNWMLFFIALNPDKLKYHEGGGHRKVVYNFPLDIDQLD